MNTVTQIHDQIIAVCNAQLGAGWNRLQKVFNPELNNFRNIETAFGVRHGSASPDSDATKVFMMSQTFEILLADRAANRDNDMAIQERLNALYAKADDIFKEAVRTKLSLYFVTHVDGLSFEEPQLLENGAVLLTASIDVKYYIDPY